MARRGGRIKGQWVLVTPEKIVQFRETNRVSRARMAAAVGVSSTSIQSWESGNVVATRKMQAKIVEVMANPATVPASLRGPSLFDAPTHSHHAQTCEATGKIVNAWLAMNPKMTPAEVTDLIRSVRAALS